VRAHTRNPIVPLAGVAVLLLGTLLAGGCQLFSEKLSAEPGPAYPETMPRGATADVQVFRDVVTLRLTNTTASAYGPGRLWLNQSFSIEAGTLLPGQTWEFPLTDFVDEFGDVFRAGGFFAQRDPAAVVLVEMENGPEQQRELVSFVVVENKYN
jgi:hypothetical protein